MAPEPEPSPTSRRVPGSFRDPSGYVFRYEGRLLRAIDRPCFETWTELSRRGLLDELLGAGMLVPTRLVDDEPLRARLAAEHPGFEHFLEHEAISPVTYPYEWTISMLADAAALTIDLQLRLLRDGFSLKDASAFNVQFVAGRPRLIDLASIERPERLDVWFALNQFSLMFTFPLMLACRRGWDLRSYFFASPGGRDVNRVARSFGRFGRLRPELLLDVTLPALLGRWAEGGRSNRSTLAGKTGDDPTAQVVNLRRLRKKLGRMAERYRPAGGWTQYADECPYSAEAEQAKRRIVGEFLEATRPATVLDLGCNTGEYSRLAAASGATVAAVDADHDAVEVLYRRLREAPATIAPMVVDLCNPSPGLGFLNREREPFLERAKADCVLALALLHHLVVSGNLSLEAVAELLSALAIRDVVLEFVPPDDPMFQRLMKFRLNLYASVTLKRCREVFDREYELLGEHALPDSRRTLLLLRRRG